MFVHHSYKGRETLWFLEQPLRKELTQKGKSCFSGSKTFSFSGQARQGHFDSCFLWTCIYTPPLETDLRCVIIPNMGIAKKLFLDYPNFWLISMGCNFADPNQSTTDLNLCCLIKIYWEKNRALFQRHVNGEFLSSAYLRRQLQASLLFWALTDRKDQDLIINEYQFESKDISLKSNNRVPNNHERYHRKRRWLKMFPVNEYQILSITII